MVEYQLWDNYTEPMKTVEKIANLKNMNICTCIDKDYNVVVYIYQLSKIKDKRYLSNLEGRGKTYREACIDFIINIMDKNYNLRYEKEYYITSVIRSFVMSLNIEYLYMWKETVRW